jgi:hypothetical protein
VKQHLATFATDEGIAPRSTNRSDEQYANVDSPRFEGLLPDSNVSSELVGPSNQPLSRNFARADTNSRDSLFISKTISKTLFVPKSER